VNSTAVSVTVDSALVAPTLTSTPAAVDQGQTSVLSSSTVTTGSGGYTYQWFSKASGAGSYSLISSATSASYSFVTSTSTATGNWGFILQVNDSAGSAVNSTSTSVTVDSALVAPTVTPAPLTVDQGQTSVLSSSAGSGSYTYQWFAKAPSGSYATVGTNSATYNFTTSVSNATGTWNFILQVTDSTDAKMNSTAASVTINSALVPPTLTPTSGKVAQGKTAVLSSSAVTTGSGSYTYQWFAKAPKGSYDTVGTDSTSYNFVTKGSTTKGSWSFMLQVTDSTGAAVNSTATLVTVNASTLLPPWLIDLLIIIVVIAVVLIVILFVLRRRARKTGVKKEQPQPANVIQPVNVAVKVDKAEIVDNTLKFFVAKGRGKKQWVNVKEIPVSEITHIENLENKLSVTWKDVTYTFFTKEKTNPFGAVVAQINGILEEQRISQQNLQKTVETNEKTALRRSELLGAINASMNIIDLSFDILIGLQEKRINWQQLETLSNGFSGNMNFTGQTLPPLNLDFSKIAASVKTQLPKEASKEAFNILKDVYGYFNGLNPEGDTQEAKPSIQTIKTLMSGYFMLNDLLLAKCVGEKDSSRETTELDTTLQSLAEANFKVDVEELKGSIDRTSLEGDKRTLIEDSRAVFKEQLKQLWQPDHNSESKANQLDSNDEEPTNHRGVEKPLEQSENGLESRPDEPNQGKDDAEEQVNGVSHAHDEKIT
jgi:hypothetical protein